MVNFRYWGISERNLLKINIIMEIGEKINENRNC